MKPKISSFVVLILIGSANCALNSSPSSKHCTWLYRENPDDCKSYYQCLHGLPVLQRCPRKLNWNPEGMYCDWEYRTSCEAGKGKGTQSQSSEFNTFSSYLNSLWGYFGTSKGNTVRCKENEYIPDPEDCNKFYACGSGGAIHQQSCPPGLYFDPEHKVCNFHFAVNCQTGGSAGTTSGNGVASVTEPEPTQPPTQKPTTTTTTATPSTTTSKPWTSTTSSTLPPFIPESPSSSPPPSTTTTSVTTTTRRPTTTTVATRPPTTTNPPSGTSDFRVVCYFTNWAVYRPDGGKFQPADIDTNLCNVIIYAFACMNPVTYKLEMCDSWIDGKDGKNFIGQITSFRKLGITVLVAVGGWNDSGYLKWDEMLKDPTKMEQFIWSAKNFIEDNNFQGLDIDYEYPSCPQVNCAANTAYQKNAFTVLIRGLRQVFGKLLITLATSANENIIKQAYDIRSLSKYVDYFHVMSYDYYGAWEKSTGINAPLLKIPELDPDLCVYHTLNVYIGLGAKAEQIVVGVPMYGQSFKLSNPRDHRVGAPVEGPGQAGNFTKQSGMLAYYEICTQEWSFTVTDPEKRIGPYSVNQRTSQWVSYDDLDMIGQKCNMVLDNEFAGIMVWSLSLDDFGNKCGGGSFPLLKKINEVLKGPRAVKISERRRRQKEQEKKQVQRKKKSSKSRSRRRRF